MKRKRFALLDLHSTDAATKHVPHGENRFMSSLRVAILAVLPSLVTFSHANTSQGAPQQKAAHNERVVCPSTDFIAFFHDFSEKMVVQKVFTRFPLIYGKVDLTSDGAPFRERKINSYAKIPVLNHDNRLIFPDEKERTVDRPPDGELYFEIKDGFTDDFEKAQEQSTIGRN